MFCSIVRDAVTNRRPFWARSVTLACTVVLLVLCANLMVAKAARADVVGGTLDAVGGSQPLAPVADPRASETSTGDTSSGQTPASSQPASVGTGTSVDGSASRTLADPVGTLGGTVGTAQHMDGSAGVVIADAPPAALEPTAGTLEEDTEPVGQAVAPALQPVGGVAEPVMEEVEPVSRPVVEAVEPVVSPVKEAVEPVLEPVKEATEPVLEPVAGVTEPVVDAVLPDPDAPDERTPQGPGGGAEGRPRGGLGEAVTVPPEPRSPAGALPVNDDALVPGDYSGSVARSLDSGSAPTRYGATANSLANSLVYDAPSAVMVAVSGSVGSALAYRIADQPRRTGLWFFESDREGLGAAVAGGSAVSPGAPFSTIGNAIPWGASLENAGSAFGAGLACCVLLLYFITRRKPTWASSRVAAPSSPLRLVKERPG